MLNCLYHVLDYVPTRPFPFLRLLMVGSFALILAVGRLYDSRLGVISILISVTYIVALTLVVIRIGVRQVPPHVLTLIVVSLILLISSLVGEAPPYGREKLGVWFTITLPVVCAFLLYGEDLLWPFLRSLALIGFGLSILALLEFEPGSPQRLGVLKGGPIVLARWVCLSLLCAILLPRVPRAARLLVASFAIPVLYMAASRGPMLALALSLLGFGVLFRRPRILVLSALPLLLLWLPNLQLPSVPPASSQSWVVSTRSVDPFPRPAPGRVIRDLAPSASRMVVSPSELAKQTSFTDRVHRIQATLRMIRDYPMGVGIGRWAPVVIEYGYEPDSEADYVHNVFLEVGSELGVLPMGFVLLYVGGALFLACSVGLCGSTECQVLSALLIYWIANSCISGDLSDARQLFVICALAYLFSVSRWERQPRWVPDVFIRLLLPVTRCR